MRMQILRLNSCRRLIVSRRDDLQAPLHPEILCVGRMAVLRRSIWCRRATTCIGFVIEAMHSSRRASGFRCSTPPSQRASERMATLLLPVAVQLFSEKPAAPPPAAGFFVLWPRPNTFEINPDGCRCCENTVLSPCTRRCAGHGQAWALSPGRVCRRQPAAGASARPGPGCKDSGDLAPIRYCRKALSSTFVVVYAIGASTKGRRYQNVRA